MKNLKTKKIICLYGAAGCGKTTVAYGLCYFLKLAGYNTEFNSEYIKDWCWEGRKLLPGDQTYIFAKQARKERIYIQNSIDFIITDSPLILTHFYGLKYDKYEQEYNTSKMLLKHHHGFCKDNGYKVDHIFLERAKPYSPAGRYQDEETAKLFDLEIKNMMDHFGLLYSSISSDEHAVQKILEDLEV